MQRLSKAFSTAAHFGTHGGIFRYTEELPFRANAAATSSVSSLAHTSSHSWNFYSLRFKALQATVIEMQKVESSFRLPQISHPLESAIFSFLSFDCREEPIAKRLAPLSYKGAKKGGLSHETHFSRFAKTPTLTQSENSGSLSHLSNSFLHVQHFPASSLAEISPQVNTNVSRDIPGVSEKNLDKLKKGTKRLSNISANILSLTDAAARRVLEILDQRAPQHSSAPHDLASDIISTQESQTEIHNVATIVPILGSKCKQRVINDGVRISLKRQGCNGLSYKMTFADESPLHELDEIVEEKGVTVVIDYKAVMYLVGTQMDFVETEISREFVFHNPNKKTECGCGKSFSV
ncbi:iron-sulfur cluster protein ISCA [Cardiosporidium cionae]|uniref:Iron-sulfur cluster protein ISCA n=1 Tax=Cardiosporidium cionae TaxID=476202 RepID=A0ABQ7J8I7_9APIC|nr:iron-sulfur cluster protein ISCA [Cardiosporidium cionae]|eukprot:KAF8820279.1 iron-sulfur cluster protein ISCA [Cardiosporidium cionae]